MNWFERHLNWTLFLGLIYIPANIGFTAGIFLSIILIIVGLASYGFSSEALHYLAGAEQTMGETTNIVVGVIILLALLIAIIRFGFWFLDRKGRSRAYVLWLVAPPFIGFGIFFFSMTVFSSFGIITGLATLFLGPIVGLIILLLLGNQIMTLQDELLADRPDIETYGGYDDRQSKELDYTPAKNVLDMMDRSEIKDAGLTGAVTGAGDVVAASVAGEVPPAQEKVTEKVVSPPRLNMPILLDDSGAAITCFYHPGADAVNMCSRCKQYVCNECNYVTGTNPICRNCWEKRAETPLTAVPAKKPESPASGKPEKQKSVETGKPEKQKIAAPGKAEKPEAKKLEWLPEFMALYEQASPIINVITRKSPEGTPASPLDLMEGLKLRPMLERAKKLSKPKDKELREAKSEFEQVLSSCIKIADSAANFVSGGGQALLGGPDFTRIVDGIETANGLMEKLSQRLSSFPHPQE